MIGASSHLNTAPPPKQRHHPLNHAQAVTSRRARAVRSGAAAAALAASAFARPVARAMAAASDSSVFRFQQQEQQPPEDARQYAAAASRNEAPILEALVERLKQDGDSGGISSSAGEKTLLEIACGTGQHSAAFARALVGPSGRPLSAYVPTDRTDALFASVRAHGAASGVAGLLPPRVLDVSHPPDRWFASSSGSSGSDASPPPPLPLRAVLAINLTHIAPWAATLGLLRGAAAFLDPSNGRLLIYGPFTRGGGRHVGAGDGNARFDASLRAQDPAWGYRDVDRELVPAAEACGLALLEAAEMPANNLLLVFSPKATTSKK